mgnify:CR=1 FL=1
MKSRNIWPIVGLVSLVVVALAAATVVYRRSQDKDLAQASVAEKLVRPYSPSMGPADAPVTIVEFLDPECEACRAMAPIVKRVVADFPGKVRLVVRYMPFHGNSALAASLLEGAREQGKYWEALDRLFELQPEWGSHDNPRAERIAEILVEMGLDKARLEDAVRSGRHAQKIEQDRADGMELGVRATPSFFVNGTLLRDLGYEPLRAAVEASLRR